MQSFKEYKSDKEIVNYFIEITSKSFTNFYKQLGDIDTKSENQKKVLNFIKCILDHLESPSSEYDIIKNDIVEIYNILSRNRNMYPKVLKPKYHTSFRGIKNNFNKFKTLTSHLNLADPDYFSVQDGRLYFGYKSTYKPNVWYDSWTEKESISNNFSEIFDGYYDGSYGIVYEIDSKYTLFRGSFLNKLSGYYESENIRISPARRSIPCITWVSGLNVKEIIGNEKYKEILDDNNIK